MRTHPRTSALAVVAALAGILAALIVPSAALADEIDAPQTWSVAPARADGPDGRASFDYIVEPGNVYEDHVVVRNLGERPLTVTLYAQDAVQTTENAFEVLTPDDEAAHIGAWVRLGAADVTVPARDRVVVPFEVVVPEDAAPGDHVGGIVAVNAAGPGVQGGAGAAVQYRVGTRVHLRVAGNVEAGLRVDTLDGRYETRWTPFAAAPLDVTATLVNTGNVRLAPDARVQVTGLFGWWSGSAPLGGFAEILPGGAQSGAGVLDEVPAIGPLWVTVEVTAVASAGQDITGMTRIETRTVVVWAMPWVLLGAVALLLVALGIALRNLWLRRRARRAARARDAAEAGVAVPGVAVPGVAGAAGAGRAVAGTAAAGTAEVAAEPAPEKTPAGPR
ncbi:WxL protein peptidoglycan domain-containing protein [Microbacterium sp. No. 7]|uniref:WxL protein peptidoglycan domain-containing protein n=1 Tax=Microbacterium sp. No. 7 TaxID=1714373 RepID=UPI0006D18B60|nr:DUF916 domain-containing protein [Microbacterium sp. No. 7]